MEFAHLNGFSRDRASSGNTGEWCSNRHLLLHDLSGNLDCRYCELPVEMDAELWSRLPEDLLERVLRKLPIRCLCRLRSVCTKWRSTLTSERFVRRCTQPGPCISAFEVVGSSEDFSLPPAGSTSLCRVYRIDLSFIPCRLFSVATSHKGLICFNTSPKKSSTVSLCLCNPITRMWKALPELTIPVTDAWEAGMMVDDMCSSFKVVVMCNDLRRHGMDKDNVWTYHEYTSESDAWRIIRGDESTSTFFGSPFLLCRDLMYCIDIVDVDIYYTEEGKLVKQLQVGTPPDVFSKARLMEYRGDVLLVGDILAPTSLSVGIWKLDRTRAAWDCISVFPEARRKDMARNWGLNNCHVDLVYVVKVLDDICLHIDVFHPSKVVGLHYVLAYNMQQNVWHTYHMKSVRHRAAAETQEEFWQRIPPMHYREKWLTLIEPRLDMFI